MESGEGGGNEGRFVTPQVPWLLYTMFRMSVTTIGVLCLYQMIQRSDDDDSDNGDDNNSDVVRIICDLAFQIFTTLPVGLELTVHLVRSAVHLSPRKDILGRVWYCYLLVTECLRFVFVGAISIGTLAVLPRVVTEHDNLVGFASAWCYLAYPIVSALFSCVKALIVRLSYFTGTGVPIPIFHDSKDDAPRKRFIPPYLHRTRSVPKDESLAHHAVFEKKMNGNINSKKSSWFVVVVLCVGGGYVTTRIVIIIIITVWDIVTIILLLMLLTSFLCI
jgi:hypothetical protein